MRVVSYLSGIPKKNTSPEKPAILNNFITGVCNKGDDGISHTGLEILDCDVAVIQGYVHQNSKNLPHLQLRRQVIELQRTRKKRTLVVDSNLFLYKNKSNKPHHYLRYSFDGVFRKTGFYFDTDVDPKRWQKISKDYDMSLTDYRSSGEYVLLCLQRNGGWSMKDTDVLSFCKKAIKRIESYTDRPILIRAHPGDKKTYMALRQAFPKYRFTNIETPLTHDLNKAWATVVYNSSPGVASLIEGVPVFQMDTNVDYSMYGEIANFDLSQIENPVLHDRQDWIERISMCHWKFSETQSGEAWEFMKKYV
jgi:hypothetical protein